MSRRLPIAAILGALVMAPWSISEARAQERPDIPQPNLGSPVVVPLASIHVAERNQPPPQLLAPPVPPRTSGATKALNSLYVSTAVMQGLDVHSTFAVLNSGGGEGNPVMAGVVTNKAAFIGIKAGIATGTILAARQIAKRNKVAAIATLVAINSAYAFVVQHNYRVARSLQ
jgi:hypothetical protein